VLVTDAPPRRDSQSTSINGQFTSSMASANTAIESPPAMAAPPATTFSPLAKKLLGALFDIS
jgi:hypothetical protein